jgi:hypothetical protein
LSVIAFDTEAAIVAKILTHLGLPTTAPTLAPARWPAELSLDFESDALPCSASDEPDGRVGSAHCRAPPEDDFGL